MQTAIEKDVSVIAREVSRELDNALDLSTTRHIPQADHKEMLADSSLALQIDGKTSADDIVLLIASPAFPTTVKEDAKAAQIVADRVSDRLSKHISKPLYQGDFDGQTFAAFGKLAPISENRVLRAVQKQVMAPRIVAWLAEMASETKHVPMGAQDAYFREPLRALMSDQAVPKKLRDLAECLLKTYTQSPRDDLWVAVEHGDFWIGNVLFDRNSLFADTSETPGFTVIDWRGSYLDGYAGIDVTRFLISLFSPKSLTAKRLMNSYQTALGLSNTDMVLYCTLSLGRLLINLDQLPMRKFNAMSLQTLEFLEATGRMSGLQTAGTKTPGSRLGDKNTDPFWA